MTVVSKRPTSIASSSLAAHPSFLTFAATFRKPLALRSCAAATNSPPSQKGWPYERWKSKSVIHLSRGPAGTRLASASGEGMKIADCRFVGNVELSFKSTVEGSSTIAACPLPYLRFLERFTFAAHPFPTCSFWVDSCFVTFPARH